MGGTLSAAKATPLSAAMGALTGLVWLAAPALAESPREADRDLLRKDWHACVRQAFSDQPATIGKQTAQRAALARCKPAENAYVAAELAVQQEADEARRKGGLTTRARAWMSSVAGTVVDPVLSWIGR